ncbi:MAG: hypothetical protein R3237_04790 [Nitrosopumilaceae archaeon]|nr:hypothetical protein [Nitrosopumilaceae archaeon]
MKNFFNKIITGFFVFVFGIAWYCTTQNHIINKSYKVVVYDVYGKESDLDIRTKFQNSKVAFSYIKEYQEIFPHLNFSVEHSFPEVKRRTIFEKIFKIIYK